MIQLYFTPSHKVIHCHLQYLNMYLRLCKLKPEGTGARVTFGSTHLRLLPTVSPMPNIIHNWFANWAFTQPSHYNWEGSVPHQNG